MHLSDVSAVLDQPSLKTRVCGHDDAGWHTKAVADSLDQLSVDYQTAMMRATADYKMRSAEFRQNLTPTCPTQRP